VVGACIFLREYARLPGWFFSGHMNETSGSITLFTHHPTHLLTLCISYIATDARKTGKVSLNKPRDRPNTQTTMSTQQVSEL
jgi:hypothetical protein